jgi:hypothetical protein
MHRWNKEHCVLALEWIITCFFVRNLDYWFVKQCQNSRVKNNETINSVVEKVPDPRPMVRKNKNIERVHVAINLSL